MTPIVNVNAGNDVEKEKRVWFLHHTPWVCSPAAKEVQNLSECADRCNRLSC